MAGNHDTPPLRLVVKKWLGTDEGAKRAAYLAQRLVRESEKRDAFARTLEKNELAMQEAMLADCFVGPARRVIVFWADLFGEERIYNRPGVVHEENWTLRMAPDFEREYATALMEGRAPRLDRVLSLALAAR
jgi:4-alpha-glucanotransferase